MGIKISMAAARKNKKYSQKVAAEKIGVSLSTLKNWENGHTSPKAHYIGKICEVYEMPYDCIFFN